MFQKINSIVMWVLIGIGVLLMVFTIGSGLSPEQSDCTDCGAVGGFITLSYILLILTIVAALGGAVMTAIMKPGQIKGTLIGIGALVVVLVLSYLLADSEVLLSYGDISESTSKWSGAGLYIFYILFVVAILSILYSSVSRLIR